MKMLMSRAEDPQQGEHDCARKKGPPSWRAGTVIVLRRRAVFGSISLELALCGKATMAQKYIH